MSAPADPTAGPARRRRRLLLVAATGAALLAVPGVWLAGEVRGVARGAAALVHDELATLPKNRVGLLLGCGKTLADGRPNLFYAHRLAAAAAIFRAGKVDFLLVSGDNGRATYDEPTTIKTDLLAAGVPADRVYLDFAGFRTLDSVVRAQKVFGLDRFTVISQRFHNERAVYLARAQGLDVVGFNAEDVRGAAGWKTHAREVLARAKAVLDVRLLETEPRFLGPKIVIGPVP